MNTLIFTAAALFTAASSITSLDAITLTLETTGSKSGRIAGQRCG